jgi:ribosomal protein S19E (S16A)
MVRLEEVLNKLLECGLIVKTLSKYSMSLSGNNALSSIEKQVRDERFDR